MTEPKEVVLIGPDTIVKGLRITQKDLEQIRTPSHTVWADRRSMAMNKGIGWAQYYPDKHSSRCTYIIMLDDGGRLWKEGSLDNKDMDELMGRLPQIFVK